MLGKYPVANDQVTSSTTINQLRSNPRLMPKMRPNSTRLLRMTIGLLASDCVSWPKLGARAPLRA